MYDLQRQQALANALMQGAMTAPQAPQAIGSGQYTVAPRMSAIAPLGNIAQGLLANKVGQQAGQGMNQLGQNQWSSLVQALGGGAAAPSPQLNPGSADGGVGGAGSIANPFVGADGSNGTSGTAAGGPVNGVSPGPQLANNVGNAPLNPLGMNPQLAAYMLMQSPDKYFETQAQAYKQADIVPQLRAAGIDPSSDQGHALARALIEKNNYIAPITGTGTFRDPRTMQPIAYNPEIPAGATPLFDAYGNVAAVQPIQGAQGIMQGNAAATAAGGAQFKPVQVYNPQTQQMEYTNEAQVTNPAHAAIVQTESNGNPNAVSPKGAQGAWQIMPNTKTDPGFGVKPAANNSPAELDRVGRDYYEAMTQRYGSPALGAIAYNMGPGATDQWLKNGAQFEKLPAETRNYVGKVVTLTALNSGAGGPAAAPAPQQSTRFAAGAPMGAQTGAESGARNLQDELSGKFKALTSNNSEAQNTISYLQSIKDLSTKAATGQQADRLNYVNGLLSLAGSEKATDAVTANNLLDKYSNQIVARLSANGMGTDSARSILQSAYPNAHMTPQAINEAADNLIGAQQMTQAKARILTPLANKRDATAYNDAELKFDQNADPRIFQYANIQDPSQRQAFAQKLIKQDPKIVQKIKNLEQMGAL
ncbi:lytic transglycosylase domain-containing protein [Caballeronia sp. ATUFL_M1_KS5A]|uniref:lytic transglycosylase domain-containing protein n=1 Tax=Caballeronia sp. ATUFL_M1_KS5A TaxID=2921778 RepID=UPI00202958E9|nr:lytic transglycosylase domain-containing protein [Caballeronia sp. ATUFL_M1_KS5A]